MQGQVAVGLWPRVSCLLRRLDAQSCPERASSLWNRRTRYATSRRSLSRYARFAPADKFAIAQRFEYFDDIEARSTGVEHILKEYTLTFEYAPEPRFITRFEYRRDWSTTPDFFSRGSTGSNNTQGTLTLGMMWVFGPVE